MAGGKERSMPLSLRIWAERKNAHAPITIKIASSGAGFISTVREAPGKRCHKHLFSKLKVVLKKNGKWPSEA
jgi:hypothetical protein